jgi:hypothetical protein
MHGRGRKFDGRTVDHCRSESPSSKAIRSRLVIDAARMMRFVSDGSALAIYSPAYWEVVEAIVWGVWAKSGREPTEHDYRDVGLAHKSLAGPFAPDVCPGAIWGNVYPAEGGASNVRH